MSQIKIDGYNFATDGDTKKRNGPIGFAKIQGAWGEPPNMTLQKNQEDDVSGERMPGFNLLSEPEQDFALKETTRIMQEKHGNKQAVGATLASLIAWKNPQTNQLHGVTCNVGDSLAIFVIIGADGKVRFEKQLNNLHENQDRSKIAIGVKRSIGDRDSEKDGLRHDPDITHDVIPLQAGDKVFAIAATDGISTKNLHFGTPALTTTDIAQTLSKFIAENPNCGPDDIAEALISRAFAGGKGSVDNTAVIVAEVGIEPISILATDGHKDALEADELGEKGDDVSKALAENFHAQLQTQMKLVKPQDYVDALREGNYEVAANLGRLLNDRYIPLNGGVELGADEVTPLMAGLFAETDFTIDDIVRLRLGVSALSFDQEAQYYMTQMVSGASTLLSNEASLMKQDANKDIPPADIRQMVAGKIKEALAGPYVKNATQDVVAAITSMEKNQEMEELVKKKRSHQQVFTYALEHLIKENVPQIRAAGNILNNYHEKVVENIQHTESESMKKVNLLEEEIKKLREDLKELNNEIGTPSDKDLLAQKKEIENTIKTNIQSKLEILTSIREANAHKNMVVEQIMHLCNKPEEFKDKNILDNYIQDFFRQSSKERKVSVQEVLSGLPVHESLQQVQQKIEFYLHFLDENPVDEPEKNPRLLKAYEARKNAAENMLLIIKTAGLREPEATLFHLKTHTKTIEANRPGLRELGFIGWLKNFFEKYKSKMTKETDATLELTKTELKKLGFSDSFRNVKERLEQVKELHKPTEEARSGPDPNL